jgi:nucleoside-diphosphate-sugar epimerase
VVGKGKPNDHSRVTFIDGDASEYRMGLTRAGYDTLIRDVRAVVHLAADSAVPGDGVNRRVAREAMDVCERADAHFYYVSTAFAANAADAANPTSRRAEATEHNLEAEIRSSGVPHTVVRTSLVIGDSVTGRIGEFPAIYKVLDALLQGLLPSDQLDHRALLDFVPCDIVADVICRLIENNVEDREVWLTAGEQALTIDQVLQAVQTLATESGPQLRHRWPTGSSGSDRQRFTRRRAVTAMIDRYVATMDRAFEGYAKWIPAMQAHFERRYPKSPADSEGVHRAAIRAKALDTLRGMLPAATQSNVGIYGTGQAFEALLLRMRAHPLPEARDYAELMLHELRKVIPSFLRRVDVAERGGRWSSYLATTRERTAELV